MKPSRFVIFSQREQIFGRLQTIFLSDWTWLCASPFLSSFQRNVCPLHIYNSLQGCSSTSVCQSIQMRHHRSPFLKQAADFLIHGPITITGTVKRLFSLQENLFETNTHKSQTNTCTYIYIYSKPIEIYMVSTIVSVFYGACPDQPCGNKADALFSPYVLLKLFLILKQ